MSEMDDLKKSLPVFKIILTVTLLISVVLVFYTHVTFILTGDNYGDGMMNEYIALILLAVVVVMWNEKLMSSPRLVKGLVIAFKVVLTCIFAGAAFAFVFVAAFMNLGPTLSLFERVFLAILIALPVLLAVALWCEKRRIIPVGIGIMLVSVVFSAISSTTAPHTAVASAIKGI